MVRKHKICCPQYDFMAQEHGVIGAWYPTDTEISKMSKSELEHLEKTLYDPCTCGDKQDVESCKKCDPDIHKCDWRVKA